MDGRWADTGWEVAMDPKFGAVYSWRGCQIRWMSDGRYGLSTPNNQAMSFHQTLLDAMMAAGYRPMAKAADALGLTAPPADKPA